MKKQHVQLTDAARAGLAALLKTGSLPVKVFRRATGLLELDRGQTLQSVATTLGVDYNTVAAWRDHYHEQGFQWVGAEGVFCAALPERGLGVAIKIDDGNNARACEVVMAAVIESLVALTDDEEIGRASCRERV